MHKDIAWNTGTVFFIMGLFISLTGVILLIIKKQKLKTWGHTTGKVVDLKKQENELDYGMSLNVYAAVVEFNGERYCNETYVARKALKCDIGDVVPIIYNPINFMQYYIMTNKVLVYRLESFILTIGVGVGILGIIIPFIIGGEFPYYKIIARMMPFAAIAATYWLVSEGKK